MNIRHYFHIIICLLLTAAGIQLTSCSEGTDQENIVKLLNDNREEISEPFVADTIFVKGDTIRIKVYVDTEYAPLVEAMKSINSSRENMLGASSEKMDSATMKMYDFSLSSPNCVFSIRYNNYAAVEIAGYYHKKDNKSDKIIISDFYKKKDNSILSSVQFAVSNYHHVMSLYGKDYDTDEINSMFVSAAKAENSLRIRNLMLPQIVDEFTTLYKIEINDDSYDYYYRISQEVSGMLDENVMKQIGNNISPTVSRSFDEMNDSEKIKSDLEILGKKVIYHYSVKNHDDENYRFVFKFPKLNSYFIEKE